MEMTDKNFMLEQEVQCNNCGKNFIYYFFPNIEKERPEFIFCSDECAYEFSHPNHNGEEY